MKQTAVEWLEDFLAKHCNPVMCNIEYIDFDLAIKKAKEMEKEQQGYSEEDLREAFKQSRQSFIFEKDMPCVYDNFDEWFNQFKKK